MSIASDLSSQIAGSVNTDFATGLSNCLSLNGISEDVINQIKGLYQSILGDTDIEEITRLIQDNLDDYQNILSKYVQAGEFNMANSLGSTGPNSSYIVQDAKYGKEIPNSMPPITKFASVPNFPPVNSELSADYPNQYGHIDDAANWYKVNKADKSLEFVHSSGTRCQIDKYGNVAVHIVGSLQVIVDKDSVINTLGNSDLGVGGNYSETVSGNRDSSSAQHINNAGSLFKVTAGKVELN